MFNVGFIIGVSWYFEGRVGGGGRSVVCLAANYWISIFWGKNAYAEKRVGRRGYFVLCFVKMNEKFICF